MGRRITQSIGAYQAGEGNIFSIQASELEDPGNTIGIIYLHGAGGTYATAWDSASDPGEFSIMRALTGVFPVLTADAGGLHTWGNDTAIARIHQAVTYMQGTLGVKAGKVIMVGASMGGLNSLCYARAHPEKVAAVVGLIPVLSVTDIHANNRAGYQDEINTAYGGVYSEGAHGATHNPVTFASTLEMPILLCYAGADPICLPAFNVQFAASAPECTALNMGAGLVHDSVPIGLAAEPVMDFLLDLMYSGAFT